MAKGNGSHPTANGSSETAPYQPPPLPADRQLTAAHLDHLRTSGLTDATIAAADLYSINSRNETIALLSRTFPIPTGPAIAFPVYLPGQSAPYTFRIRPDTPRVDKRKGKPREVKYDQPGAEVGLIVYYPPITRSSGELQGTGTLYFTEGEKKALALDQLGYTVIGLTGVDGWSAKKEPGAAKPKVRPIHPRITDHVLVIGRDVVLVFDQDAHSNPKVMRAARAFSRSLLALGAKSVTLITPSERSTAKGIDDYYVTYGEEATRELLSGPGIALPGEGPETPTEAVPVEEIEALEGAPIPDGMMIPRGYQVQQSGALWGFSGERTVVIGPKAILIAGRMVDHETGEQHASVTWLDPESDTWRVVTVTRKALIDSKSLVSELGPVGAPITSQSAKHWLGWFLALEQENAKVLPLTRSITRTGWIGSPTQPGAVFVLAGAPGYQPAGELSRVAEALRPRGTLESHTAALKRAWDTGPVLRRVICAALAAPLLAAMHCRGFAVHLCGDTTHGKTTMIRMAASIYGDPENAAWVASWNTTANAAEHRAATLTDLPVIYDEVGASDPATIARLVYTLVNGESRGRLTATAAAQRARTWRTVVLSAGEVPLTEGLPGGAQARVITMQVDGFGTLNGKGDAIRQLQQDCTDNAGQFGVKWIAELCEMSPDSWIELTRWREQHRANFIAANGGGRGGAGSRLGEYYSLLGVVEELLESHFAFPKHDPICDGKVKIHGVDPDAVESAADHMWEQLHSWMLANPGAFPVAVQTDRGSARAPIEPPRGPIYGFRVVDTTGAAVETWIQPAALRELFRKHARAYPTVLREWVEAGRVEPGGADNQFRGEPRRTIVYQGRARYVVIPARE